MVVKKQRSNFDQSPFTMNDTDQVFQVEMTPGEQDEEQKGEGQMHQAAYAAERALHEAVVKEKDVKIEELAMANSGL